MLKIDLNNLIVAGASAGGGKSAGLALMARDRGGPLLKFQLLIYPMLDNLCTTASSQKSNAYLWTKENNENAWEMYLNGTPGVAASPYAAPSRATDLFGLPPAYICVGSEDIFLDEDIEYFRQLRAANVPCELHIAPGFYHAAEKFFPDVPICRRFVEFYMSALSAAIEA